MNAELENCADCAAVPGAAHEDGCDWARCPCCGEQRLMLELSGDEHTNRPAIWHGIDPKTEVAHKLNWWTTAAGIDHLVEDYTRVLYAEGLKQITWDPEAQRYAIGVIDEAALDRVANDPRNRR